MGAWKEEKSYVTTIIHIFRFASVWRGANWLEGSRWRRSSIGIRRYHLQSFDFQGGRYRGWEGVEV